MAGIFISYRRQGSQGFAGRLADDLTECFGAAHVFRDVEIRPGDDFTTVIRTAIATSSALLVVIGPRWIDHRNANGALRLHAPGDWVRLEVEAAFARRTRVIPVLVGGAQMPPADRLPVSIRPLARIQAFELNDRRWQQDIDQLATMLAQQIPGLKTLQKIKAPQRSGHRNPPNGSPARAIRDVGLRVLEEIGRKRQPARTSRTLAGRLWSVVGSKIGNLFKQLFGITFLLVVAYVLIQNFGDPATRRMVQNLIARIAALF
jgi:hypothetical protein